MHYKVVTHYIHRTGQKRRFLFGSVFIIFFICPTLPVKTKIAMKAGLYVRDSYYLGDLNPNVHFKNA
jgi:hypothetical protein